MGNCDQSAHDHGVVDRSIATAFPERMHENLAFQYGPTTSRVNWTDDVGEVGQAHLHMRWSLHANTHCAYACQFASRMIVVPVLVPL